MAEIAPGVHELPLEWELEGSPMADLHPVAVETDSGLILVDAGFTDHADQLATQLDEAEFGYEAVELVVVTHQDIDHAGSLQAVTERSDAPVLAHTGDAPYIAGQKELLKQSVGSYPSVPVDVELVDGNRLLTAAGPMEVIATPGHTPGHIALYLPDEKLLLAGDAITADEAFDGPNVDATPDMPMAINSIGRLADLNVERTLCFHGGLVEHDPDRIRSIYEKLRRSQ